MPTSQALNKFFLITILHSNNFLITKDSQCQELFLKKFIHSDNKIELSGQAPY